MREDQLVSPRLATVLGGSGFLGRHLVRALARRGWRVRVASRRPELAFHLQPIGDVGQIYFTQANLRYPDSVAAALQGSQAVVNLVGILAEEGRQKFTSLHAEGARTVAAAAKAAGVERLVHISAIGADASSTSAYGRTKAEGEQAAREAFPGAVIVRPSIMFGPEDDFFNRFAAMARIMPVIPLVGAKTRFQPVYVGDVAQAIALATEGLAQDGATYELGGPEIKTFREIVEYILAVTERDRRIVELSFATGHGMAALTQFLRKISCGLFPKMFSMTGDQVELLRHDNVVSQDANARRLTLEGLGVTPRSIEAIVPSYLYRYRKTGQYQAQRLA